MVVKAVVNKEPKRLDLKAPKVKKIPEVKKVYFDATALVNDDMDAIAKRMHMREGGIDPGEPMSTGNLTLDVILNGGIRPGWKTFFGPEQSAKTTSALVIMAAAVKAQVGVVAFRDYEGCFLASTYLGYGKGKQEKLSKLFDLSTVNAWKPNTYPGQSRTDIDTVEPGHRQGGTGLRTGKLYYKGRKPTTKVVFNTGHSLTGYAHKMYVIRKDKAVVVKMEDLQVGEQVLVNRKFVDLVKEEWRSVIGFGKIINQRYEVSNLGQVRSVDFKHIITRKSKNGKEFTYSRNVKGRILSPNAIKDGHLWVALCDGTNQLKRLVHRIVARTFIGKVPTKKPLVLHWNDDPTDNKLSNLRYGSDQENSNDKVIRNRSAKGESTPHSSFTELQVIEIKNLFSDGHSINSIMDVMYDYKLAPRESIYKLRSSIKNICNGTHWNHININEESIAFAMTDKLSKDYDLSAVISVELTGKKEHVFDVSLLGVANDLMPHSIITNGIVTHNSTSSSLDYVQSILETQGIKKTVNELFGERDDKTGKWVTKPIVRYSEETIGERFFDWLAELLQKLPDKKRIAGKWYLIYEDTKENKAKLSEYSNKSMAAKYGSGIYIEAEDGRLQGLVITDSYPAMNSISNDELEANNGLALQARMFSKHLPRVKGRLSSKRVSVIGINQLRAIPMARYGPTEMEPCGTALKYNSDVRVKSVPRALSGAPLWPIAAKLESGSGNDSTNESEPSVEFEGGTDTYRYIHLKSEKNKLSPPKRTGWTRIWVTDGAGVARGFDPVFDTMHYLRQTGQLLGKGRKSLKLNLNGLKNSDKVITWVTLKQWVLGDKKLMSEISTKYEYKPMSLRAFCFTQVKDGTAEKLYNEVKNSKAKSGSDDEDDNESED